nr:MAG TPA: hypothetical protein [Caudoviricetes sp.]
MMIDIFICRHTMIQKCRNSMNVRFVGFRIIPN